MLDLNTDASALSFEKGQFDFAIFLHDLSKFNDDDQTNNYDAVELTP